MFKKKSLFFLIISLLLILFIPSHTFAVDQEINSVCHINSLKDKSGNDIKYGIIIAYINGVECGILEVNPISNSDICLSTSFEDIDKKVTFKLKIEDVFIDLVSNIPIIINKYFLNPDIELTTLQELPPLVQHIKVQYNNQLFTQDKEIIGNYVLAGTITVNIEDILNLRIFAIYSDGSEKDITEICNFSSSLLKKISPNVFKAIRIGERKNGIIVEGFGREMFITLNVVDISPSLLQSYIQDNVTNIPISNTFTFTFDKNIQQGNDFGSISILNSDGNPCGIVKTITNDTLTITPIVNLKYDSNYILYIPANSIKNLGTQSNTTDLMYHFTTEKEPVVPTMSELTTLLTSKLTENLGEYITTSIPSSTSDTITMNIKSGKEKINIKDSFDIASLLRIVGEVENVYPVQSITINSHTYQREDLLSGKLMENVSGIQNDIVELVGDSGVVRYDDVKLGNLIGKSIVLGFYKTDVNMVFGIDKVDECFIATACFGSKFESHVVLLRQFRDNVLLKFSAGQWFVKNYYQYSPPIANIIANNEVLKFVVRMILTPIIFSIEYWKGLLISLIGVGIVIGWRRKIVLN